MYGRLAHGSSALIVKEYGGGGAVEVGMRGYGWGLLKFVVVYFGLFDFPNWTVMWALVHLSKLGLPIGFYIYMSETVSIRY
jgi:hypothetical protein